MHLTYAVYSSDRNSQKSALFRQMLKNSMNSDIISIIVCLARYYDDSKVHLSRNGTSNSSMWPMTMEKGPFRLVIIHCLHSHTGDRISVAQSIKIIHGCSYSYTVFSVIAWTALIISAIVFSFHRFRTHNLESQWSHRFLHHSSSSPELITTIMNKYLSSRNRNSVMRKAWMSTIEFWLHAWPWGPLDCEALDCSLNDVSRWFLEESKVNSLNIFL